VWPRDTQKYAKNANSSTKSTDCTNGPTMAPLWIATPANSVTSQIASTIIASYVIAPRRRSNPAGRGNGAPLNSIASPRIGRGFERLRQVFEQLLTQFDGAPVRLDQITLLAARFVDRQAPEAALIVDDFAEDPDGGGAGRLLLGREV